MSLGSNFIIKKGKLSIDAAEWLIPIRENYPKLETEYFKLEPSSSLDLQGLESGLSSVCNNWLPGADSNHGPAG